MNVKYVSSFLSDDRVFGSVFPSNGVFSGYPKILPKNVFFFFLNLRESVPSGRHFLFKLMFGMVRILSIDRRCST